MPREGLSNDLLGPTYREQIEKELLICSLKSIRHTGSETVSTLALGLLRVNISH
jgi:hypothetical protein